MPEKIELADGTEREVPTTEELTALEADSKKLKEIQPELEKLNLVKVEVGLQEGQDLIQTVKDMHGSINPNWPKFRKTLDNYKLALKNKGIETDEDGNVIDKTQIKPEDVTSHATLAATEAVFNMEKEKMLSQYDKTTRPLVERYFDKLSAGEEKSISNLFKFMQESENIVIKDSAQINPLKKVFSYSGGRNPAPADNNGQVPESAKEMGKVFNHKDEDFDKLSKPLETI